MSTVPLAVVILTHNEEPNIARCLDSVAGWAGQVFVVDSFSTDRTVQIARNRSAHVHQRAFQGFADQRNWALTHLPFAVDWVLFLDADEWLSEPLKREIADRLALERPGPVGYYLSRRHRFMGRWLRYGGLDRTQLLRLFRRERGRCESRLVDEHFVVDGPTAALRGDLFTEDRKGIGAWIDRHNRYARLEARELLRQRQVDGTRMRGRLWGSQPERKRWIRERLWNRLPLFTRPVLLFVYRYVLRGGFLDGSAGLVYHLLESFWYRLLIDLNYRELLRAGESESEVPEPIRAEVRQ